MLPGMPEVFPFLRRGKPQGNRRSVSGAQESSVHLPSLKVTTDRTAYRPGDSILATIDVLNDKQTLKDSSEWTHGRNSGCALLIENLVVEVKGLEKLDPQWLITPTPIPGSKQRRGERTIFESSPIAIVSNIMLEHGKKKTYLVRTLLPKVLPPSYRGTVVRYLYYIVVSLQWSPSVTENGHSGSSSAKTSFTPVEIRTSLNIWTMPNNSGLTSEEFQSKEYWGIVPRSPVQVEIFWKERNDDTDWIRAADVLSGAEDEYASQGTESAMQSPVKGGLDMSFERILQLQSPAVTPREVVKESFHRYDSFGHMTSKRATSVTASTTEMDFDGPDGSLSNHLKNYTDGFAPERRTGSRGKGPIEPSSKSNYAAVVSDDVQENFAGGNNEHDFGIGSPRSPSGGYIRGRSYNIRFDDQILVRFSPKNPDSTYYFGDVVGGVLNFCHDEGSRRCLEVSAVLEIREVLNPAFIHPSRKNSPIITKVQSDYYEVVVDMLQTHFVFSIPFDGPPSFTTPQVSIQWVLRLEFVATSRNVDWSKIEHPLLIEEREKGEWLVPIVVHAPLPRTQTAAMKRDRPPSPKRDFWGGGSNSAGKRITPLTLPPSSQRVLEREERASSSYSL